MIRNLCSGLLLLLFACSTQKEDNTQIAASSPLEKVKTTKVMLDKVTSITNSSLSHVSLNGNDYLVLLNWFDNKLGFYDVESGELQFKIQLEVQGPNGVGALDAFPSSAYVHNMDSIFVFNRKSRILFMVDSTAQVNKKWNYSKVNDVPSPYTPMGSRMYLINERLYMMRVQSFIKYYEQNPDYRDDYAGYIDLRDESTESFLSYPDIYKTGMWGFPLYNKSWAYNKNANEFLVSFHIDPTIYRYNPSGELLGTFKGNGTYQESVRSLSTDEINKIKSGERQIFTRFLLSQPRFGNVYYDEYNGLLFRSIDSGLRESVLDGLPPYQDEQQNRSFVVFDQDYNYLGEHRLKTELDHFMFFTNEGAQVIRIDIEDEDAFYIDTYKLKDGL